MSKEQLEQISALVDDELEQGSRFVLNILKSDETYKGAWGRYFLIGESMRGHLPQCTDIRLADRVSRALHHEQVKLAAPHLQRLVKPVAGLAIAASVAAITVLGVQLTGTATGPDTTTPAIAYTQTGTGPSSDYQTVRVTAGTAPEQTVPNYKVPDEAQARLNRYLVNYNEYRTNTGVQGILPYVRIVTHEVGE